jgi:hypothetical protein
MRNRMRLLIGGSCNPAVSHPGIKMDSETQTDKAKQAALAARQHEWFISAKDNSPAPECESQAPILRHPCLVCGKVFDSRRRNAKTCGSKCRKALSRQAQTEIKRIQRANRVSEMLRNSYLNAADGCYVHRPNVLAQLESLCDSQAPAIKDNLIGAQDKGFRYSVKFGDSQCVERVNG